MERIIKINKVINKLIPSVKLNNTKTENNITFDQIKATSGPLYFLTRELRHSSPPGSGARLIPWLLPCQDSDLTSVLTANASVYNAGLSSSNLLIALSCLLYTSPSPRD